MTESPSATQTQGNFRQGMEAHVALGPGSGHVFKQVRRIFRSHNEAGGYIDDAKRYSDRLAESGFLIPDAKYNQAYTEHGLLVTQEMELIEGADLSRTPDSESFKDVIGLLQESPVDSKGNLCTPVDAKPDNFVRSIHGEVYLVDILPPLVRGGACDFPYDRIPRLVSGFDRDWADRFVRGKSGSIARFAGYAATSGLGVKFDLDVYERILSGMDRAGKNRVDRNLALFFAHGAMRKVARIVGAKFTYAA